MIQLDDEAYAKLKKDADDNRQLVNIIKWLFGIVIFLCIFCSWGLSIIKLDIQKRQAELNNQLAIEIAETNVQVRKIEQSGLTMEDYFTWLDLTTRGNEK